MNRHTAEILLRSHRSDQRNANARRVSKALEFANGDDSLKAEWENQSAFDTRCMALIQPIAPSENLKAQINEIDASQTKPFQLRTAWKQPPMLAALCAILLLIGLLVWFGVEQTHNFSGRDAVEQMLQTTEQMTGNELKPVNAEVGNLGDWVFMNYQFDNFSVPAGFQHFKAIGARIFDQDGSPIVQIAVPKNNMLFYIFHANDFHVKLKQPNQWHILQHDDWVAALRGDGENCFMIAFHGTKDEMQNLLQHIPSPKKDANSESKK